MSLPTMSRIVTRLVERGLVLRESHPDSRRRLILTINTEGETVFEAARVRTLERIAARLERLTPGDRLAIERALELLARGLASSSHEPGPGNSGYCDGGDA